MKRTRSVCPISSRHGRRSGFAYRGLLIAAPVLVAILIIAVVGTRTLMPSSKEDGPMMHTVQRGNFVHVVTEHGSVESANNMEVRCEVESHGGGAMILWIIDEGTHVEPAPDWKPKEPGEDPPDVLVKLDSSSLEDKLTQQQITCNSSEAAVAQATNNYETAKIAKLEYLEGTYEETKSRLEGDILLAEEKRVRAQEYLEDSKRLYSKGFISSRELQADEFEVEQRNIDLDRAQIAMEVLEKYSKERMLLDKEAAINIAAAKLKSEEHSHQLDLDNLAEMEEQIEKCTIRAPQAGQVVYANIIGRHGSKTVVIEEGVMVREGQVIIKLPDPTDMQIKAKINEARIALVEVGMAASIELDAFPDMKLQGTVERVNEYPLPGGWMSGNVKEYETIVKIDNFPPNLEMRSGMTAKVSIRVEQLDDVLVVPVQAVFEHGGKHYCVFRDGERWKPREIVLGATNDKKVILREGIQEGDKIVLGASLLRDELDLPEIQPETESAKMGPGTRAKSAATEKTSDGTNEKPGGKKKTSEGAASRGPGGGNPGNMFQAMDKNGDGKLEKDEIPDRMKASLSAIDTNSDGTVDPSELNAMMQRMRSMGGGRPGGPGVRGQRSGAGGMEGGSPRGARRPKGAGAGQGGRP